MSRYFRSPGLENETRALFRINDQPGDEQEELLEKYDPVSDAWVVPSRVVSSMLWSDLTTGSDPVEPMTEQAALAVAAQLRSQIAA